MVASRCLRMQAPHHESSRIFRTDVRWTSSRLSSGIAKGSPPFAWGVGLCPTSLPLSRRLRRREKKREKGFFGDTPNPSRGRLPSALPLFLIFVSKIRDDSWFFLKLANDCRS